MIHPFPSTASCDGQLGTFHKDKGITGNESSLRRYIHLDNCSNFPTTATQLPSHGCLLKDFYWLCLSRTITPGCTQYKDLILSNFFFHVQTSFESICSIAEAWRAVCHFLKSGK